MLSEGALAELQRQLQLQNEQFAERLRHELPALGELAGELQHSGRPAQRREQVRRIREQLHKLAGAAGSFGFGPLGERARVLEQRANRWLDSSKPSAQALGAFARAVRQFAEFAWHDGHAVPDLGPGDLHDEPLPGCRIYLLESDAVAGAGMAQTLDNFGYETLLCRDFPTLQQAVEQQLPDALIVSVSRDDELLPIAALQQRLGTPLPLLAIHADAGFASQLAAVRAGAQGFFSRPLDLAQLENSLERCLNRQQGEPYRVLIVDDDHALAERYGLVLRNSQMQVQTLSKPQRVLELMHTFNPEVLVLDVDMPGCSGPELAQMIRLHDEWLRVTIIYLSAETDINRQMAALLKAGDDFLSKPLGDSELIAAVYSHAQRARSLSTALSRDSLTGLLKHADIKDQLAIEVQRASRASKPTSVVMLDLDHFKQVNDRYGHAAGDSVIRALANLLRQRLRRIDSLGRYGGEEFVAVLPECTAEEARRIFDEIRERFATLTFNASDARSFTVSLSAGISATEGETPPAVLLEQADQALYIAKRDGRNQVRIASAG